MIHIDRDPTLKTLLIQEALKERGLYTGELDNWQGRQTTLAYEKFLKGFSDNSNALVGDGTWGWTAEIVGDDIVIQNASASWFGGSNDPLDNGDTASGIKTKGNPDLIGFSLPMDGFPTVKTCLGSPIPRLPWKTPITVSKGDVSVTGPLIDIGPSKWSSDEVDLTVAAFKKFAPLKQGIVHGVKILIHGGAKYVSK